MAYVSLGQVQAQGLPPPSAFNTREKAIKASAQLTSAQKAMLLQRSVDALPSCYGERTVNCLKERYDADKVWSDARCRDIAYGWLADWDAMQAKVEAMPYCDERQPLVWGAAGAIAGLLLGFVGVRITAK